MKWCVKYSSFSLFFFFRSDWPTLVFILEQKKNSVPMNCFFQFYVKVWVFSHFLKLFVTHLEKNHALIENIFINRCYIITDILTDYIHFSLKKRSKNFSNNTFTQQWICFQMKRLKHLINDFCWQIQDILILTTVIYKG